MILLRREFRIENSVGTEVDQFPDPEVAGFSGAETGNQSQQRSIRNVPLSVANERRETCRYSYSFDRPTGKLKEGQNTR